MTDHPIFIHIPKCAGTFILSSVAKNQIRIAEHIEAFYHTNQFDKIAELAADGYILSGHLTIPSFHDIANRVGINPVFYASFRHPVRQLLSQLNWQIETALKGPEFLNLHPDSSLEVIKRMVFCDHSDPEEVFNVIDKYPGYFLNNQSTFMIGERNRIYNRDLTYDDLVAKVTRAVSSLAIGCHEDGYTNLISSLISIGKHDSAMQDRLEFTGSNKSHMFFSYTDAGCCKNLIEGLASRQYLDKALYEQVAGDMLFQAGIEDLHKSISIALAPETSGLVEKARKAFEQLEKERPIN